MSDEDPARQDIETAARSVVRAHQLTANRVRKHFKYAEWSHDGLGSLVFGMIDVGVLFTLVFAAVAFSLQPVGPNDLEQTYEIAATVLAAGISIAAFCNRNRRKHQGRSANIVVAAVELFKPLLFTGFFIFAALLLQFPLFLVYFLRLCFQRLGLSVLQHWLQQHMWPICAAFLLTGLLSVPVVYLYRSAKWRASAKAKDRVEGASAPTLAETVWSAEAALTVPAMLAFIGFMVTVSAMITLGDRP
jgi:hypothetical protein